MTMSSILKLKPAFTDEQAQALAALFDDQLATKTDLEKLKLEVERDVKAAEARLIAWVVGQGAAVVGILFALLHFFGK